MRKLYHLISALLLGLLAILPLAEARIYPPLLGTHEYRQASLNKFPKWASMLARWRDEVPCTMDAECANSGWQDLIHRLQDGDLPTKLQLVNSYFNAKRYVGDTTNWGKEDYWATPYEFLQREGDCEDFAIAKFMALKAAGVRQEMRILALNDRGNGVGHAVLIVYDGTTPLMLDNQIRDVVPVDSVTDYEPIYSINELSWWRHRP